MTRIIFWYCKITLTNSHQNRFKSWPTTTWFP